MSDPVADLLRGIDGPRPMPPGLRARLGGVLARGVLAGVDEPRTLPAGAAASIEQVLTGVDGLREMPAPARVRIEEILLAGSSRARAAARRAAASKALGIAAALVLVASLGAIAFQDDPEPEPDAVATGPSLAPLPAVGLPALPEQPASFGSALGGVVAGESVADVPGSAPPPFTTPLPYASDYTLDSVGGSTSDVGSGAPRRYDGPIRLGIVRGDPQIEQGFERYMALVNSGGGIRGGRVEIVEVGPEGPGDALATVNASATALAGAGGPPSWVRGPLLETTIAGEAALRGRVFGLSSIPEHQARVLAHVAYPDEVASLTTAVIYHAAAEPYATVVPDALEDVLSARGVTTQRVAYDPASPAPAFAPADTSFLSMDSAASASWLRRSAAIGQAGRIAMLSQGQDPVVLAELGERSALGVSPFQIASTVETRSEAFGGVLRSSAFVHGWVTAKALAVAIYQDLPRTASQTRAALGRLDGFLSNFFPRLEYRPGTHVRRPDAIAFTARAGGIQYRGGFRTDPLEP
ncbi:MAG TPA: hypothetical protein VGB83_07690 [Actinomycetota bacterium]